MIVYLSRGMTRLALRIRELGEGRQLTDWRRLQLLIQRGQFDRKGCGPNGSPWFLEGCWPGHCTGIDVANPQPVDFPTICYNAYDLDADGRVVFRLDEKFQSLPTGRYSGTLRTTATGFSLPLNMLPGVNLGREPIKPGVILPPGFRPGDVFRPDPTNSPVCGPFPHPEPCCILTMFDIDIGPECSDHMVDQVVVDFALSTCGEEHGEA